MTSTNKNQLQPIKNITQQLNKKSQMKTFNSLILSLVALACAATMNAQTKVYITGSTAFRGPTTNAINALLPGATTASDNATLTSANAVTWTGGSISGNAVTVKVSWSGSAGGIQTVAGAPSFNVRFLPDGASGTSNPDPRQAGNPAESAVPDVCMSDVFQPATPFNGTLNGVTYATVTDNQVGVVVFVFAASKNFPLNGGTAPISNYSFTPQLAQVLFPGGLIPLSTITGLSADHDTGVIATGRDFDSGTRLTAMAESGVGVSSLLRQWKPTISAGAVTSLALYPRTTINGVDTVQDGNSGESSGSSLRAFLTNTVNAAAAQNVDPTLTGGFLLTYLGVGDFNSVSGSGAVQLLYTGNQFSQTNVEEGKYTFWGYEHLDYKSTLGGVKRTFADALRDQIKTSTSATLSPNVALSDMQVQRFADGGPVSSLLH